MRHLATAASRARYLHRADRQRPSGQALVSSPEEILVFDSSDGSSRPSRSLSEDHYRSPSSVAPTSTDTSSNPCTGSEPTMKPRFVTIVSILSRVFCVLSGMPRVFANLHHAS